MPQIGFRIITSDFTFKVFINGRKIILPFFIINIQNSIVVNNMAFRPFLVGITQSNISTPIAIHSRIFQGVPTPIRYLGFSFGKLSQHSSQNFIHLFLSAHPHLIRRWRSRQHLWKKYIRTTACGDRVGSSLNNRK